MILSALFSVLSDIGTPFSLDVQQIADQRRAVGTIVETGTAWGVPMPGSQLLVSAAIDDENCFKFKWLRS
jgi:hypothetical protein